MKRLGPQLTRLVGIVVFVMLTSSMSAWARCPLAGDLTWIPAAPQTGDSVTIRLRIYNAMMDVFLGTRSGNVIQLNANYAPRLTQPPFQDSTWNAGPLPGGTYRLDLSALWYNQIPPTQCPLVSVDMVVGGGAPAAVAAPSLSAWGLAALAALLALAAWLGLRRRA